MNEPASVPPPSPAGAFPSPARFAAHALLFGAIGGILAAGWGILEMRVALGQEQRLFGQIARVIGILIPVLTISFGIMRWRDRALGGTIRFAQSFGIALAIGLVIAAAIAGGIWLYAGAIDPGVVDRVISHSAEIWQQQEGVDPAEVARQTELARQNYTAGSLAGLYFNRWLILNLVIALASAIIIRKRPLPRAT